MQRDFKHAEERLAGKVFFGFSFLQHSCVPNAALLMDVGPDVTLVALSEVLERLVKRLVLYR